MHASGGTTRVPRWWRRPSGWVHAYIIRMKHFLRKKPKHGILLYYSPLLNLQPAAPVCCFSDRYQRMELRFRHLLILSATRTAAYDYGEDVTICWVKRCGPM